MSPIQTRLVRAGLGLVLAILLFATPSREVPGIDKQADAYFESAMTQAGVAYATCRVINASVSVIADSQVQLEPAGIGVSLAAGKVLDPIDDMTARLSNVLVTAIVSLGVQKLAYEMGVSLAPTLLAVVLVCFSLTALMPYERTRRLQHLLLRVAALMLVARFLLPITSSANDYLLEHFFAAEIQRANAELALDTGNWETLQAIDFPESEGFWNTLSNSRDFIKAKALALKDALTQMTNNLGDIIENLLTLTWLFAGIFLIQVIVLPLAVLWLMVKLVNALFALSLPTRLHPHGDKPASKPSSTPSGDNLKTT